MVPYIVIVQQILRERILLVQHFISCFYLGEGGNRNFNTSIPKYSRVVVVGADSSECVT